MADKAKPKAKDSPAKGTSLDKAKGKSKDGEDSIKALTARLDKLEAEAAKGSALTPPELLKLRRALRCYGDATTNTLDDDCIMGPPNLGYQY